jgi:hypothetical protein
MPLAYSETADKDNQFSAGVVAAIVAVIVLVAAGITAAIVLTRKPEAPTPPKPGTGEELIKPASMRTAVDTPGRSRTDLLASPILLTSSEQLLAIESEPVELAGGVSLTPADGWVVSEQGDGIVVVDKEDGSATMFVLVGVVETTDVEEQLQADIQGFVENSGLANVKVTKTELKTVESQNFQEAAMCGFTGDLTLQQGTVEVIGMFLELMNPSDGLAAFVMFMAGGEEAFDASAEDADSMIGSML